MACCNLCGADILYNEVMKHRWAVHPEVMKASAQKGRDIRDARALEAVKKRLTQPPSPSSLASPSSQPQNPPAPVAASAVLGQMVLTGGEGIPDNKDGDSAEQPLSGSKVNKPSKADDRLSKVTTQLDEASFVDIVPKTIRITSTLFQMAKSVTEREWDWPQMDESEWLENYFYHTMRKFGIRLGGYVVERRGNGQNP